MRIVLVGNPNVGKSSLFSRITGTSVICSNYPGTTVSYCSGKMKFGKAVAEVIDTPGLYSLKPQSPAEKVAVDMLAKGDIIINVVDATNLERNLYLTLEILELGMSTVVALNMADDARHLGVQIDADELERLLGVPVVETVAVSGQGIKELVETLDDARKVNIKRTDEQRWSEVGRMVGQVQTIRRRKHTIFEIIEDATVKPETGIPIALAVLYLTFMLVIGVGNFLVERLFDPIF
jgi:ferrous iron transport protein B